MHRDNKLWEFKLGLSLWWEFDYKKPVWNYQNSYLSLRLRKIKQNGSSSSLNLNATSFVLFPSALVSRVWILITWNWPIIRTVKKFLSSGLIMNHRQLWILHQRHKFLKFWNFESRKCHFQGFSRCIFSCGRHVLSSEYMQDWEQCHWNVPGVPRHSTVQTFHRSKPV